MYPSWSLMIRSRGKQMTLARIALCTATLLCAAVPALAQQTGSSRDLTHCQDLQNKFVEARSRHDVDGMASLFAEDGIRMTPDGVFLGRDAIRRNPQSLVTAGLRDFTTQRTVSRLEGGILFDAGEWHARLGDRQLHGYYSALLSCDGGQPMMLEETTNVAPPAH
jgi:ketosteroid isomerase-like protein